MKLANVFQCNIFTFENKLGTGYGPKYCKIKLFSGAMSHGASNEQEAYLAPSRQTSMRKHFCKNRERLQAANYFPKKAPLRCLTWF